MATKKETKEKKRLQIKLAGDNLENVKEDKQILENHVLVTAKK